MRMQMRGWQYVRRLREIADKCDTVESGQVPALRLKADIYRGLLAKCLPDLKAIEHSGTVSHRRVEDLSDAELAAIIAGSGARDAEAPTGETEPSELH